MSETIEQLKHRAAKLCQLPHLTNEQIDVVNDAAWELRFADTSLVAELGAQSLQSANRNDYQRGRALAFRNLGWCRLVTDQYKEAELYFEESREICMRLRDNVGLSSVSNLLGATKRQTGNCEAALEAHLEALRLREKLNDHKGISAALTCLGVVHFNMGNFAQSLDYYYRGLQMAIDCGAFVYQAHSMSNLGEVFWHIGEAEEAISYSKRALAMWETNQDQRSESISLNNLAAAHQIRGEHAAALQNYQLALQIAEQVHTIETQAEAKIGIGSIYNEMGETEQAHAHLFEALQLSLNIGSKFYESHALLALGKAFQQAGELRESLELLERALEISQELNLKEICYKTHLALSESFEQAGNVAAALFHHQQFHIYHQEINGTSSMRQIQQLLWHNKPSISAGGGGGSTERRALERLRVQLDVKDVFLSSKRANALPQRQLQKVVEFIEHHLEHNLTLADLADVAALGQRQFQSLFKRAIGKTPHQFILEKRITRAKQLLRTTDLPLSEIALSCGFSSQSHLSTQFRLLSGYTPLQFRRSS